MGEIWPEVNAKALAVNVSTELTIMVMNHILATPLQTQHIRGYLQSDGGPFNPVHRTAVSRANQHSRQQNETEDRNEGSGRQGFRMVLFQAMQLQIDRADVTKTKKI
ncbi:hypothetical protein CERZMDRAFT_92124 [Cercospora zeae-maydis SCOH1-5]|uniref:Uncharacterized protein n=1 Tax=Cercospora zeae-maydis SCOH1-5 TaxID=717836 RepID=A0A6A6FVS2_9PEZI|nr:hypothetical protein CERZMDRAFT_92124 [Cercospora zeae-maydis SCOH1-5]